MSLGSGEIQQRSAVALRRHDPQIDLQARAQHHRGAGGAMGENLGHILVAQQSVGDRGAIARGRQDVEIADRVAAAAKAAATTMRSPS